MITYFSIDATAPLSVAVVKEIIWAIKSSNADLLFIFNNSKGAVKNIIKDNKALKYFIDLNKDYTGKIIAVKHDSLSDIVYIRSILLREYKFVRETEGSIRVEYYVSQ